MARYPPVRIVTNGLGTQGTKGCLLAGETPVDREGLNQHTALINESAALIPFPLILI